jgi:hypothetical protein
MSGDSLDRKTATYSMEEAGVKRVIEKGYREDAIQIFSVCGKDEAVAFAMLKSR